MQIYMVGGAVRDTLLGLPVTDRDWVVVGATAQQLIELGYTAVGRDFPVFLHPRSREQYALARTERKTAPGYRGFAIHASPDVTLEQDLARRDLTINAMAVAAEHVHADGLFDPATAVVSDPHQGLRDLQRRQLRHVSDAFREDPVRILRVARFAARFTGFEVAPETMALMRSMVAAGEVAALVPERVWQELAVGLMEADPARMFDVLQHCGALAVLLPELTEGTGPGSGGAQRPYGTVLAQAVRLRMPLPVRFACLGLQLTADMLAPLCARLRVPQACQELAQLALRERAAIADSAQLDAAGLVRLLERCDALRKPDRFGELLQVCECDARAGALPDATPPAPSARLLAALQAARAVTTDAIAARAREAGIAGEQVGDMIRAERVAAVAALARL